MTLGTAALFTGKYSMQICGVSGSILDANQHPPIRNTGEVFYDTVELQKLCWQLPAED